jgi:transposase InsO family protein
MKRGSYQKVTKRNEPIIEKIRDLKADHPFWGYRRIWAHLNFIDHISVSQNKIHRLMKQHDLIVPKNMKLKAKRKADTKKPVPSEPNQWWGIDMTKVMIDGIGWIYVVIVIDWHTKKVVGHYAGLQAKAWHWLVALNKAVNFQFPEGVKNKGLHLMADNGCQPTATSFMKACSDMGVHQAFTSYNNPKGNADTERFMRTLKEELVWINEWRTPTSFLKALDDWIERYNTSYLHSSLGYMPPNTFEQNYRKNMTTNTLLKSAC